MKRQYVGNVILELINKTGFMPAGNRSHSPYTGESPIVLEDRRPGSLTIIELVDGDAIDADYIAFLLENKRFRLLSFNFDGYVTLLQVFIFDSVPDNRKLEIIKNGQYDMYPGKRILSCYSVILERQEIQKLFNFPSPVARLDRILREGFRDRNVTADDIAKAVDKKIKNLSVEFRARKPRVTYVLIFINILVWFLLTVYSGISGIDYDILLILAGAKVNSRILAGEYWRLITPVFLHGDMIHLLLNSWSLYVAGSITERLYGHSAFAVIYFVSGLCGSIASLFFTPGAGVGASGAIFGLMGALIYFGFTKKDFFRRFFGHNIIIVLVLNLVYGFVMPGIDNSAHIGGLAGGFVAAALVKQAAKSISLGKKDND